MVNFIGLFDHFLKQCSCIDCGNTSLAQTLNQVAKLNQKWETLTKLGLVTSKWGLHKLQWIKFDRNCILKNFVHNNSIYDDPFLKWHNPLVSWLLALRSLCLLHYLTTFWKLSDDCLTTVWLLHHPTPMFLQFLVAKLNQKWETLTKLGHVASR